MAPANVRLNPAGLIIAIILLVCIFFYIFGIPKFAEDDRVSMRGLLSVSIDLAKRGGQKVRAIAESQSLQAKEKGKTNEGAAEMLTQGDLQSHRAIVYGFSKTYPGMRVISEEHETKPMDFSNIPDTNQELKEVMDIVSNDQLIPMSRVAIWIDPLDATQEYTEGLYQYVTTMVCVVLDGEPTIGVIHKPFTDETAWAWVGHGQSQNLQKASDMTPDENHQRIIVSRSHSGPVEEILKKSFGQTTEVVSAGGAGYKTLEVIKGNVQAYVHVTLIKKWDICAGDAILKALEGKMTTLEGNFITYWPDDDPKNEDGLLATIYNHYDYLKKLATEKDNLKTVHR